MPCQKANWIRTANSPGLMVLRPVINEKTVDEWVMEELL